MPMTLDVLSLSGVVIVTARPFRVDKNLAMKILLELFGFENGNEIRLLLEL
jgi:hypothetical protein